MIFRFLITLILSIFFISCSSDDDGISRELKTNRSLWQASQISNYTIDERLSCFCAGLLEWKVYIKNGQKDMVTFDETLLYPGQTYDDVFESAKTIEEAFDFIESLENKELASLVVEYNAQYGYPTLISIDYKAMIADDEIAYLYTNFEITD